MTVRYETIDQDIEDFEKRMEEWRQERIAEGKPPEPPEDFIPIPHGLILLERVDPVKEFVIKFAFLVHQSRKVPPFDLSALDKYRPDLDFLRGAMGFGVGSTVSILRNSLRDIEKAQQDVKNGEGEADIAVALARRLYLWLSIIDKQKATVASEYFWRNEDYDYRRENPELSQDQAEYNRLKENPEEFERDLEQYCAHYESIKHLY